MLTMMLTGCDRNPYDESQRPVVNVSTAQSSVVINWQPEGAQLVRVYRGAVAGDGYTAELVWSIAATSKNSLRSGVSYGVTSPTGGNIDFAAKPLIAGQQYTVQVTRADPKGSGDGFTNTSNRYVGTSTFVAPSP